MKQRIKSLEEEKAKLQEQLQSAQGCKYFELYLIVFGYYLQSCWSTYPCVGPSSEHDRLVATARVVVDMVDPQEEEASSSKSLVERLEEAPRNIVDYLTATSKNYLSHMLAIVKSYWP